MENVMTVTAPTVSTLFDSEVVNNAETTVSLRFVSLDIRNRTAVIELGIKPKRGRTTKVKIIQGNVTKRTIGWFSYQNPVNDEEGKPTGNYLSGYQKFLVRKGLPSDTAINDLDFQCKNHSEDYYDNPFKVSMSKTYNSVNITRVTETNMKKQVSFDPATGETNERWIYKRNTQGHVLTLPKSCYRRLEMR